MDDCTWPVSTCFPYLDDLWQFTDCIRRIGITGYEAPNGDAADMQDQLYHERQNLKHLGDLAVTGGFHRLTMMAFTQNPISDDEIHLLGPCAHTLRSLHFVEIENLYPDPLFEALAATLPDLQNLTVKNCRYFRGNPLQKFIG